jgi:hypothetical protein
MNMYGARMIMSFWKSEIKCDSITRLSFWKSEIKCDSITWFCCNFCWNGEMDEMTSLMENSARARASARPTSQVISSISPVRGPSEGVRGHVRDIARACWNGQMDEMNSPTTYRIPYNLSLPICGPFHPFHQFEGPRRACEGMRGTWRGSARAIARACWNGWNGSEGIVKWMKWLRGHNEMDEMAPRPRWNDLEGMLKWSNEWNWHGSQNYR